MYLLYLKALHIIFVVTWFAGLFYLVRLFIYHTEAQEKAEPDRSILSTQFEKMEGLLWRVITVPSMYLTLASGLYLAYAYHYFTHPWMLIKLGLVVGLLAYHVSCGYLIRQYQSGTFRYNSTQLRIYNEVATLFLVSIVFIVVLKSALSLLWGVVGLVLFAALLMLAIKLYKRSRDRADAPRK